MKQVTWEINYLSPPHITRYCKKCKAMTEYQSSGTFRVNAQKKTIDVWLIYKCTNCDTTWNMEIYSRISPGSIPAKVLDGFFQNDSKLAARYAVNFNLLQKNGAVPCTPCYEVLGEDIPFGIPVQLTIKVPYQLPVKLTKLLHEKMKRSQADIQTLYETGAFQVQDHRDFNKIRLKKDICLTVHLPLR